MSAAPRPIAFARYYAKHSWPVFPLKPHDKIPLGGLAPHGFQDASTEADVIDRWWTSAPDAGIGVPTGRASGTVVIDVDPRHGGDVSLAKLEAEHGPLPETVEAVTGGGGRHLVFAYPAGDLEIRSCVELGGLPGIDVRAEGGYIAVAPTIHPSGQPYKWHRSPKVTKPAPIPDWLLSILTGARGNGNGIRVGAGLDTGKILEGPPDGERDVDLWGLACKLRGADVPIEAAFELVGKAARNAKPPLEERKAFDKVRRAYARYEPGHKVNVPEPTPPSLTPSTADAILTAAERPLEWLLKPLFTVKSVRLVGGPSKAGKTAFTIAAMLAGIKGGTLAGHFDGGTGGHTVAWFDAENSERSWSRKFVSFCRGLGHDPRQLLESGRVAYFNRVGFYLDDDRALDTAIEAASKVNASEIVLDSLTRIHRQKESDAGAMSAFFLDRIFRLRDEVKAGVTVLHHLRKATPGFRDDPADALRGSSDLRAVVDTYIALSRTRKDRSTFTVHVSAQRDSIEAGPFPMSLDWPEDGTAVFHQAEAAPEDQDRTAGRPPTQADCARRILTDNPELSFTAFVLRCQEAAIGRTTAKKVWGEVKSE